MMIFYSALVPYKKFNTTSWASICASRFPLRHENVWLPTFLETMPEIQH
jgi:hypothetical protein